MPFARREYKYYKYGTEPNANIAGSFGRIDKGVAKGFASGQYLRISEPFSPGANPWEISFPFILSGIDSSSQTIVGANSTYVCGNIILRLSNGKFIIFVTSNGTQWDIINNAIGTKVFTAGVKYYAKMSFDGNTYRISYSEDGVDFIDDIVVNNTTPVFQGQGLSIGGHYFSSTKSDGYFTLGTIDLNESYIDIAGERWWSGESYTKVGSWIDDGVVSGFSGDNHLGLPTEFIPSSSDTWEMGWCFTTGSDISTDQTILGNKSGYNGFGGMNIRLTSGYIRLLLSNSSSDWVIAKASGTTALSTYTKYWIRVVFTGSSYELYLSTDGVNYDLDISVASSATIVGYTKIIGSAYHGGDDNYSTLRFRGSIDLNQSYIKINDKMWWHGTKAYQINVSGEDVWENWKQPVLTNYGTMGGSSFAVAESSTIDSGEEVWRLFASSPSYWHSSANLPQWISWYNPNPLKVTKLSFTSASGVHKNIKDFIIQACNDNSSWIDILSYSNANATGDFDVNLSSNDKAYKYWRIYITSSHYANISYYAVIYGLKITAQQLISAGSISDADYSTFYYKLYQLSTPKKFYYKYTWEDWKQPTFTSNTSSPEIYISDPKLSGGTVNSSGVMAWGSSSVTRFSDIYKALTLNDSNYLTLNNGNKTFTVFDVEFKKEMMITGVVIVGNVISAVSSSLTGSQIYSVDENNKATLISSVMVDNINTHTGFSAVKTKKLRICMRPNSDGGTYPSRITAIDIVGLEKVAYPMNIDGEDVWEEWKTPTISSAGTMGRGYFAVAESSVHQTNNFWKIFSSSPQGWHSGPGLPQWVSWYNPRPLKVYSLHFGAHGSGTLGNGIVQACNDNKNWIDIKSFSNTNSTAAFDIDLSDNETAYKFWRIYITSCFYYSGGNPYPLISSDFKINALVRSQIGGTTEDADYHSYRLISHSPILRTSKQYTSLFESATSGTYNVEIPEDCNVRITMVGGGGACALRGIYDDRGYGWGGGSGGAFMGTFALTKGTYSVTVGSANNNAKAQGGNTNIINPDDTSTHDSYITGVVRIGGGGSGTTSGVGSAGASATFEIEPLSITMNKQGNVGKYNSGGKGSSGSAYCAGGDSVWGGYGKGQGGYTSEYANGRWWVNGTGGYVRIEVWKQTGNQIF